MPHVGRIPSTLEKYRHALSAYLEDITQLNFNKSATSQSYSFLYFDEKTDKDESYKPYKSYKSYTNISKLKHKHGKHGNNSNKDLLNGKSQTPIPDTQTRVTSSYNM
eukprot:751443_1